MTAPTDYDDYRSCIAHALAPGFGFAEICRPGSRTHQLPPRKWWGRIIQPLELANELRQRMIALHGAKGLKCNAAFRPTGGATHSQHKVNRALDLDLLPGDYGLTKLYYSEAVRLWCELGDVIDMGLGLYCPGNVCQGIRVHIDVGYRTRSWQHGAHVGRNDAHMIAERLGLKAPSGPDDDEDEGSDEQGEAA